MPRPRRNESGLRRYFVAQVRKAGGVAKKQHDKNDPDWLVLFPFARMAYVELKAEGEKPTRGQARRHAELWAMGFPVLTIDTKALVDDFVQVFTKDNCGRYPQANGGPVELTRSPVKGVVWAKLGESASSPRRTRSPYEPLGLPALQRGLPRV